MRFVYFFLKLIPPRSTFPGDMSPEEAQIMKAHAAYFRELFNAGKILIYGPVMAPEGCFGMAVFDVGDEIEVHRIMQADPSVTSGLNRFEVSPIEVSAARAMS